MGQTNTNETEFVQRLVRDERALLRYVLKYVPRIEDATEIVQETVLTLWERQREYDRVRPFLPWACGFARMKLHEYLRRNKRWHPLLNESLVEKVEERSGLMESELQLRREWLRECIDNLDQNQRQLLTSYYFDEIRVPVIGRRTGRSVHAVYKPLQRIRAQLHECVERRARVANGGLS